MVDLIEKEKDVRAFQGTVASRAWRHAVASGIAAGACVLGYIVYVVAGVHAVSRIDGTIRGVDVTRPAIVFRDSRGIPHVRARTLHDAFFAEGFAQGSDRLFQMDLFRRYVYGQLAEIVGPIQLSTDEAMRALDVHDIVARQWKYLAAPDRSALIAFSDGVNAAMRTQPLPIEFRLLLYKPRPWMPVDCLAVTLAVSASLGDTPENVLVRDGLWRSLTRVQFDELLPLSDPLYDVLANGQPVRTGRHQTPALAWVASKSHVRMSGIGSNAWAAGGARTSDGHALLANDPHLSVGIPGVFYAIELRAPGLHAAGVTVPGIPGVVLGHNERIAWATTNAMVSTISVFSADRLRAADWKRETFHVRFAPDTTRLYYRTAREFAIPVDSSGALTLVRWAPFSDRRSAVSSVLALDRAPSIGAALRVLAQYAGPPQNFILAGPRGQVAYHMAGPVAEDPAWGRYVHSASDLLVTYVLIPFRRLPFTAPARDTIVVSANNKMYGSGYRYRLSPMFAPPYRAYRIASLLRERDVYDTNYFAQMQLDAQSPADAEFAHRLALYARTHADLLPKDVVRRLASWDGAFAPRSHAATLAHELREEAESASLSPYAAFDALRRTDPPEDVLDAVRDPFLNAARTPAWGSAGAVPVFHPFGPIGFPFLNGSQFPGDGDEYTIHVQTPTLSQSFRAVWDAGSWDRGGLSLPNGESGEIGSRHYDDLSGAWIRGDLEPLPFSDSAVRRAAKETLRLEQ